MHHSSIHPFILHFMIKICKNNFGVLLLCAQLRLVLDIYLLCYKGYRTHCQYRQYSATMIWWPVCFYDFHAHKIMPVDTWWPVGGRNYSNSWLCLHSSKAPILNWDTELCILSEGMWWDWWGSVWTWMFLSFENLVPLMMILLLISFLWIYSS